MYGPHGAHITYNAAQYYYQDAIFDHYGTPVPEINLFLLVPSAGGGKNPASSYAESALETGNEPLVAAAVYVSRGRVAFLIHHLSFGLGPWSTCALQ